MEETRLKDIFKDYDPSLSSSIDFLERLERNLDAVELIHQENSDVMRRNRRAVAIASCAGFITGVMFTLLFPYINALVLTLINSIPDSFPSTDYRFGIHLISWLLIGAISVFVALNTYNIALSIKPLRGGRQGG